MERIDRWDIGIAIACFVVVYALCFSNLFATEYSRAEHLGTATSTQKTLKPAASAPLMDKGFYDKKLLAVANLGTTTASTTVSKWPANKHVYPKAGAILPFKRIIAYYGNFYSTRMGVLGEYPKDVVKQKLQAEMDRWNKADPTTPTIPAINYIAMTAQESPGKDGKYRFRMPASEVQKALDLAAEVNGIVILDIQIGTSNLQTELPLLEEYLKRPEVHLGLDPEFAMKNGAKPGTEIGTLDAADINYTANYLAKLVREHNLPPKIIIVHRFTQRMVTNYKQITPLPEVQIVMDMDGWGPPAKKIGTYRNFIAPEPVQFTGFKIFYKNDLKPPSTRLLTPEELLKLSPQPVFIQYQ